MKLSILIPVYTEEKTIIEVLQRVKETKLDKIDYEIIVINDGSTSLMDFRVESDNNTHMIYVDGANDKVGINSRDPQTALDIDADAIRLRIDNTPSSASDFGHKGEIRWDANYIYICVATDTWKRVALSTW